MPPPDALSLEAALERLRERDEVHYCEVRSLLTKRTGWAVSIWYKSKFGTVTIMKNTTECVATLSDAALWLDQRGRELWPGEYGREP
jgi:hypothetical protein